MKHIISFAGTLGALIPSAAAQLSFESTGIQMLSDDTAEDAVVVDFNEDGFLDVAFAMSGVRGGDSSVTIRLGDGTGAFPNDAEAYSNHPVSLSAGDFDEDGHVDLAVLSDEYQVGGVVRILHGDGNGNLTQGAFFQPYAGFYFAYDIAAGDFDEDGHMDLAVTGSQGSGVLATFSGVGDGTFTTDYLETSLVNSLKLADIDVDGHVDILTGYYAHLGAGDGTFTKIVSAGSRLMDVCDFDSDGVPDLVAGGTNITTLTGNGDGTFAYRQVIALPSQATALSLADINADGWPDVTALVNQGFVIALGTRTGIFGTPTSIPTGVAPDDALAIGDWNSDGLNEVALAYTIADESWMTAFKNTTTPPRTPRTKWAPGAPKGATYPVARNPAAGSRRSSGHQDQHQHGVNESSSVPRPPFTTTVVPLASSGLRGTRPGLRPALLFSAQPTVQLASEQPNRAYAADINGDFHLDILTVMSAIYGSQGAVAVNKGDGTGDFNDNADLTVSGQPRDATIADLDNDGDLDIAVVSTHFNSYSRVQLLWNDGAGNYQGQLTTLPVSPILQGASSIEAGDFDNDGDADLVVGTAVGVAYLEGDGAGGFAPYVTASFSFAVDDLEVFDADGDGNLDFFGMTGGMYLGSGDGTFSFFFGGTLPGADRIQSSEMTGDGVADLVFLSGNMVQVFAGNGLGGFSLFSQVQLGAGQFGDLQVGDIDLDGKTDLVISDNDAGTVLVLLSTSLGSFTLVSTSVGLDPKPIAIGDWNEDSQPDLFVGHDNGDNPFGTALLQIP